MLTRLRKMSSTQCNVEVTVELQILKLARESLVKLGTQFSVSYEKRKTIKSSFKPAIKHSTDICIIFDENLVFQSTLYRIGSDKIMIKECKLCIRQKDTTLFGTVVINLHELVETLPSKLVLPIIRRNSSFKENLVVTVSFRQCEDGTFSDCSSDISRKSDVSSKSQHRLSDVSSMSQYSSNRPKSLRRQTIAKLNTSPDQNNLTDSIQDENRFLQMQVGKLFADHENAKLICTEYENQILLLNQQLTVANSSAKAPVLPAAAAVNMSEEVLRLKAENQLLKSHRIEQQNELIEQKEFIGYLTIQKDRREAAMALAILEQQQSKQQMEEAFRRLDTMSEQLKQAMDALQLLCPDGAAFAAFTGTDSDNINSNSNTNVPEEASPLIQMLKSQFLLLRQAANQYVSISELETRRRLALQHCLSRFASQLDEAELADLRRADVAPLENSPADRSAASASSSRVQAASNLL